MGSMVSDWGIRVVPTVLENDAQGRSVEKAVPVRSVARLAADGGTHELICRIEVAVSGNENKEFPFFTSPAIATTIQRSGLGKGSKIGQLPLQVRKKRVRLDYTFAPVQRHAFRGMGVGSSVDFQLLHALERYFPKGTRVQFYNIMSSAKRRRLASAGIQSSIGSRLNPLKAGSVELPLSLAVQRLTQVKLKDLQAHPVPPRKSGVGRRIRVNAKRTARRAAKAVKNPMLRPGFLRLSRKGK